MRANGTIRDIEKRRVQIAWISVACKWHKFENISDGFVCVNSDSDYCADWTEYGDSCEEWEKRNE